MRKFLIIIIFFLSSCSTPLATSNINFISCGISSTNPCSQDQIKKWESKLSREYNVYRHNLRYKRKVSYFDGFTFDSNNSNPDTLNKEEFINIAKSSAKNYNSLVDYNQFISQWGQIVDVNFSDALRVFKRVYDRSINDGNGGKIYIWEFTSSSTTTSGGSSTTVPITLGDYTFYSTNKRPEKTTNYVRKTYINVFTDKNNYVNKVSIYRE